MKYDDFLNRVKEEHARLYETAEKHDNLVVVAQSAAGVDTLASSRDEARLSEIRSLVDQLKLLARKAASLEDYRWVSDALLKWQVIVTNTLDEPIDTDIPPLPRFLSAPPSLATRSFTGNEVGHWLRSLAEARAGQRKTLLGRRSTVEEMKDDSDIAKTFFSLDVISGKINFASRIGQESYPLLEETWLKDAKNLLAYLMWLDRLDDCQAGSPLDDYYRAVSYIRGLLVNKGMKAKPQEFGPAHRYLEQRYLSGGVLDHASKEAARDLVRIKARRIYEVTGNTNAADNWLEAETYAKLFYENIIPASVHLDKESTLKVLKAFQFSKAPEHCYYIITAFETALAIYFLHPDVVRQLWDDSAAKSVPETVVTSSVKVASWPNDFVVPKSCVSMFFYTGAEILFRGVMSQSQLDNLANGLSPVHLDALRELFEKSRLIHQETTL